MAEGQKNTVIEKARKAHPILSCLRERRLREELEKGRATRERKRVSKSGYKTKGTEETDR